MSFVSVIIFFLFFFLAFSHYIFGFLWPFFYDFLIEAARPNYFNCCFPCQILNNVAYWLTRPFSWWNCAFPLCPLLLPGEPIHMICDATPQMPHHQQQLKSIGLAFVTCFAFTPVLFPKPHLLSFLTSSFCACWNTGHYKMSSKEGVFLICHPMRSRCITGSSSKVRPQKKVRDNEIKHIWSLNLSNFVSAQPFPANAQLASARSLLH